MISYVSKLVSSMTKQIRRKKDCIDPAEPAQVMLVQYMDRQELWVWMGGKPATVAAPVTAMIRNSAGLLAMKTRHLIRNDKGHDIDRQKLCNALHTLANHAVGIEVLSKGSKPLSPLKTKHCVSGAVSKVRPSSKAM